MKPKSKELNYIGDLLDDAVVMNEVNRCACVLAGILADIYNVLSNDEKTRSYICDLMNGL